MNLADYRGINRHFPPVALENQNLHGDLLVQPPSSFYPTPLKTKHCQYCHYRKIYSMMSLYSFIEAGSAARQTR
jgi:hypothetical protein